MTIDTNPIPVMFNDEELIAHVRGIIANMDAGDRISFNNICGQIIQMASSEGKLKPNTQYTSSELNPADQMRVSSVMWDLIMERKVFTVFGSYLWFARRQEDTLFVIK